MRPKYYRRDGTPNANMLAWAVEFERVDRRVAKTVLPDGKLISTVFLGLDHNFQESGPPLIFETMVFENGKVGADLDQVRYSTEEEAKAGHERMVKKYMEVTP